MFVHKFKLDKQKNLLAYRLQLDKLAPQGLVLLVVGPGGEACVVRVVMVRYCARPQRLY